MILYAIEESPNFFLISNFDNHLLVRMRHYPTVVLIYISLITSGPDHIFISLFVMSFGGKSTKFLVFFFHILNWVAFILNYQLKEVPCIS